MIKNKVQELLDEQIDIANAINMSCSFVLANHYVEGSIKAYKKVLELLKEDN